MIELIKDNKTTMNNTRKAIIELIEPYMDKELKDGCLVICKGEIEGIETENGTSYDDIFIFGKLISDETYNIFGYVNSISVCTDYMKNEYDLSLSNFNNEIELNEDTEEIEKILGHYDITAVHKYIAKNRPQIYTIGKYNYHIKDETYITLDYPIKPLHLYTEQEEKKLLKLLKQLGKQH